ncbi:hypothetical protein [Labedaea rhizosphaerae]|uniref:hypothetical protein n=1 Tax=Labedaea rhizosphaerae TaxID=598644 RepID=UPI00105DDDF0|nr:hypothetical protein [Labedaea rhizosphaerae]
MTSANRLLDVVNVFAGDHRVELTFVIDHGSVFSRGAEERVRSAGYLPVAMASIRASEFDLALAASDKGALETLDVPLVLLAHGAGYHRHTGPARTSGDRAVSGLAVAALRDAHRFPTVVGLAHPAQRPRLREVSAAAARRAEVVGDPCLDRLVAGTALRDVYREAFSTVGRTLVVVNSTWGPNSLFGSDPQLVSRLLAELPVDTHRVALVLHPNVWAWHGPGQVRAWLVEAREAGLIIVPPEEGWRAALIAADAVISDHGSVTCYAAALGRPVALAADGGDEVVAGSPMDLLRKDLPRIRGRDLLLPQLEDLLTDHRPELTQSLTTTVFDQTETSTNRMRRLLYSMLDLAPPRRHRAARPLPIPELDVAPAQAHAVQATVVNGGTIEVRLERFAAVFHDRWLTPGHERFLAAFDDEHDLRLRESASVVAARQAAASVGEAHDRVGQLRIRFPAARTTACRVGSHLVVSTAGAVRIVACPADPPGGDRLDDLGVAAALHAIHRSGLSFPAGSPVIVTAGGSTVHLEPAGH